MSYEHQLHLTMRFPSETDARAVHRAFQSLNRRIQDLIGKEIDKHEP